jgi:hypothetical protein
MKMLKIFLLLVIMKDAGAQLRGGYVYTIIGDASVLTRGKPTQLKQGTFISQTDTIILKRSASLTLLDYNNKFIMISQPGKYNYSDLQKSLDIRPTGITEKYFHFVWEDLFKPGAESGPVSSNIIGGAVGGAKRGSCASYLIAPADGLKVDNDTIQFRWHNLPGVAIYQLGLYDSVGNEFINIIVKDTSVSFLKRNLLRGEMSLYHWTLMANGHLRDDCSSDFIVVSEYQRDNQIQMLTNNVSRTSDEFIYYLQLSETLAQNGWYNKAADCLNKAKSTLGWKSF